MTVDTFANLRVNGKLLHLRSHTSVESSFKSKLFLNDNETNSGNYRFGSSFCPQEHAFKSSSFNPAN